EADEAAGNRRRGTARRSSRRAAESPGVVGDAVDLGNADVEPAELAGRGLADGHDTAAVEQALDVVRGVAGDAVLEYEGGFGPRPPHHRLELLDSRGHAAK